mgnify:CR=1 FL=1|jgi:DNA (cytosine-5)-methyltransferase 1
MPKNSKMRIASFFAGAGGLDLGFEQAGFDVVWANEFDKGIWATYRRNHPKTHLDERSITDIKPEDIGSGIDGMIGGPPCQSWSLGGAMRGLEDPRGQLFYDYIRLVSAIKPKFFLAENVSGIISQKFAATFEGIKSKFAELGYVICAQLFNAVNYEVPQDRLRVIIVGINKDYLKRGNFAFPEIVTSNEDNTCCLFPTNYEPIKTLRDAIGDLPVSTPALEKQYGNSKLSILNHEHMIGGFSPIYMSRNRKRDWNEPSFTIQASGRQAPLHPSCPPMRKIDVDHWEFTAPFEEYRRLSVRECARIQTFPDDFEFIYDSVPYGYKMIGNAVPVRFAYHLASAIKAYFAKS